ncbi:hypothetical protein BX600DRAFT_553959 [Xylariales sp. PMI_506]|nr:hypothetical protein BX600DRAFT_553959 [Xylariales sp. PMI_506]
MPAEKRNNFLDADESDQEDVDRGYDSEEDLRKGARSAKRRKVDGDSDISDDDDDDASINEQDLSDEEDDEEGAEDDQEEDDGELDDEDNADDEGDKSKRKTTSKKAAAKSGDDLPGLSRPLLKKNLVATDAAVKKSGVIYLSRIPPFMKPQKLRSLLEPYGTINRIFLTPEDPTEHARRVRNGGNKKRSFTDGWVEFVSKKDAKQAVELLNGRTIGGKKGSFYRDDIWSVLYLHKFKWSHLTEQIASEAAERQSRMRAEISRAQRENKEFVRNVDRAKMLDGMRAKKESKAGGAGGQKQQPERTLAALGGGGGGKRTFEQSAVVKKNQGNGEKLSEDSHRVASMLF